MPLLGCAGWGAAGSIDRLPDRTRNACRRSPRPESPPHRRGMSSLGLELTPSPQQERRIVSSLFLRDVGLGASPRRHDILLQPRLGRRFRAEADFREMSTT